MPHFFADDGEKIHFHDSGQGSPVVLLHGWTSSHQEWFPFVQELQKHHRILRWDARGHGCHQLSQPSPPTVQRMAQDLHQLLAHTGLSKAVLVGHSMGALTIWQYIRDYGCDHLEKICLIDQSPKLVTSENWDLGVYGNFTTLRAAEFIDELRSDFPEAVLRLGALGLNERAREKYLQNAPGWAKARTFLKQQTPEPLIACWQSLTEADYRDVLEQIDVPALLIYGGASNFYHQATAHYVHDHLREAILHIYEGTDHSPHQWQRERFIGDLLAFTA